MTTPLSLSLPVPAPADATPGAPETAAPGDAFAALLAALTGAVTVPTQVVPAPAPGDAGPEPSAVAPAGAAGLAPSAVLAALAPSAPAAPMPATALVSALAAAAVAVPAAGPTAVPAAEEPARTATWQPTAAVRRPAESPVAGHPAPAAPADAPVAWQPLEGRPPVVRREVAADAPVDAVVTAQQVLAPAAAPTTAADPVARAEGVGPARHVKPAVLEAASRLRHEGGGRTSLVVRLDPPELGAVVVRLTVQDGRVDVQLRTPDLAARSDLQAQSYDVQQVLRDNGLDLTSFDVSHGELPSGDLRQDGRGPSDTPDRGTPRGAGTTDGAPGTTRVTDDVTDPQPAGTWL